MCGGNSFSDIDECYPRPCMNGATCQDWVNAYNCVCVTGYIGGRCETGRLQNQIEVMLLSLLT